MLCDPRLYSAGYGKLFLACLPPMPVSRALADVEAFFSDDDTVVEVSSPPCSLGALT